MSRRSHVAALLLVLVVVLAGCTGANQGGDPVDADTASPTVTATTTPTETATASPSPTPTPTPTARGPDEGTTWTVVITRVIDGDTVEARFPNGQAETLRLLGVDTPETTLSRVSPDEFEGIPDTTAGRDHLFTWGERATAFARDELQGETVRVEVDPTADRRGSFGRLLVHVYVDGEHFNRRLLTEGYARLYDSEFALRDEFVSAEARAQRADVGLWGFDETAYRATPTPTSSSDLPPLPADGDYDCSHFDTQDQAQRVLEGTAGDPHRLDGDDDGIACESLP